MTSRLLYIIRDPEIFFNYLVKQNGMECWQALLYCNVKSVYGIQEIEEKGLFTGERRIGKQRPGSTV